MYDCAIIGTGIAGISAALTLKALKKSFILLGDPRLSQKVRAAEEIHNYPALTAVSGGAFASALLNQLESEGIDVTAVRVNGVYPTEGGFSVMCGSDVFEAKTVILATGMETLKPVKGETEFLGRGVSYCAVCDGFLYKDKVIAVFAESDEELSEVSLLAKYAREVRLFCHKKTEYSAPNVIVEEGRLTEIKGDMRVRSVVGGGKEIPVDGVFMLKQSVAADTLVYGIKCEGGAVVVDRACATNVDGVFAAGDCTGKPYQYAKAAGEGNVCAYSVYAWLNSRAKK